jgi:hypothetical protein
LPAEFKRLQQETQQLLKNSKHNKNIIFTFVNPLENDDSSMDNIKELYRKADPINITVDDKGKQPSDGVLGLCPITAEVNIPLLK